MNTILVKKNSFEFQRWIEEYNPTYLQNFITEEASGKYKIDRFITSNMLYLWYPEKAKYIEIATQLDMTSKSNVKKLIDTFDTLIIEGKI